MRLNRVWLLGLGVLSAIAVGLASYTEHFFIAGWASVLPSVLAQSAPASPQTSPNPRSLSPSTIAPTTPNPETSASPSPLPTAPSTIPEVPVAPSIIPTPPAPPASTDPPLPISSDYQDPGRRFKVGVLKDYKVSPLAGSVLIEAPDGNLAYTVVPQSQPLGKPIGLIAGYDNSDSLAKVATSVFQRGEGFQPGIPRPEAGGGAVIDWTGTLTIAGSSQPVGGMILVRPSAQNILLLLIAATQAGADQVPGAIAALANSLQAL
ncbi:MAG: hypothetical protein HC866_20740 [Leptolyngbyaceae cyanobacterium RU_5_1]|nr:hypothetical protein [Leptolyngbyaceae cyanobacterium RU_5_1]